MTPPNIPDSLTATKLPYGVLVYQDFEICNKHALSEKHSFNQDLQPINTRYMITQFTITDIKGKKRKWEFKPKTGQYLLDCNITVKAMFEKAENYFQTKELPLLK